MNVLEIKASFISFVDFLKENKVFFIYLFILYILFDYGFFIVSQQIEVATQCEILLRNDQVITLLTETLKNKELLREKISTLVENEEIIDLCLNKLLQDQELKEQIEFQFSKPKEYIKDPSFLLCVGSLCIFFLAVIASRNQN